MVEESLNRIFNLVLSSLLFILLLPLFFSVYLVISLDSSGNPIFYQKRVGRDRKKFLLYKFRTMREGSEVERLKLEKYNISDGPIFKHLEDPRVTRVGQFLRKGFDELPQLINVIRGEMDLVGPRPFLLHESMRISKKYMGRLSVNPGMTSPAVLDKARHRNFKGWMKSDLDYVKRKSILFDLGVLFKTVKILF